MRRIWISIAVVVVVCGFSVWFYFAPYLAVRNMRQAAENRDTNALSSYVDYPALRESLKANLTAMMASEAIKNTETGASPFGILGAAIAVNLVNTMIDNLVTPEGVELIVQGNSTELPRSSTVVSTPSKIDNSPPDVALDYENFDRFTITYKDRNNPSASTVLTMARENLFSWKLVAVRIPNLPAPGSGLELRQVTPSRGTDNSSGAPTLAIDGQVANISGTARPVPQLRITLRDASNNELKSWMIKVTDQSLAPGAAIPFHSVIQNPPDGATGVIVGFGSGS